jgi:hypothetical protein
MPSLRAGESPSGIPSATHLPALYKVHQRAKSPL